MDYPTNPGKGLAVRDVTQPMASDTLTTTSKRTLIIITVAVVLQESNIGFTQ